MSYEDPIGNAVGGFVGIALFLFIPILVVAAAVSVFLKLPPVWQLIDGLVFIVAITMVLAWRSKTKVGRELKRLVNERQSMENQMDSRIWWQIEVTIPDSLYGGSDKDFWSCDVNVASSDEKTAQKKAIDLVRKRNHSYDDMRVKMERVFTGGNKRMNETPIAEIFDGPFRTFRPTQISGQLFFRRCDFSTIDKEISELSVQIEENN